MALPSKIVRQADIPSPSPVLNRLIDMLFDPNTSMEDLATTLATDAGLAARTLRSANAAFSSPRQKIDNVRDALVRVGLITAIHIITTAEIGAVFFSVPGRHGDMKRLWTHNLMVACLADAYAQQLGLEKPARWFTAGLLHDIGRLVLLRHDPVRYADMLAHTEQQGISVIEAEKDLFGSSHEEIGEELMRLWQFPEAIVAAAFHHDQPFVALDDLRSGVGIVNKIANALERNKPLPTVDNLEVEKMIASASVKYEVMKEASGF